MKKKSYLLVLLFLLFLGKNTRGFFHVSSTDFTNVPNNEGEFFASLRDRWNTFLCPATIISSKYAVTTAECVYYLSTYHTVLITGTKSLINGGASHKINKFHIHQNFSHKNLMNDVALIELEDDIEFDKFVNSIHVSNSRSIEDESLNVYTWKFIDVSHVICPF